MARSALNKRREHFLIQWDARTHVYKSGERKRRRRSMRRKDKGKEEGGQGGGRGENDASTYLCHAHFQYGIFHIIHSKLSIYYTQTVTCRFKILNE